MSAINGILEVPVTNRDKLCPKIYNNNITDVPKTYNNFVGKNLDKPSATPTWAENLSNYFSEFCNSSGIHGVRYLKERGRFVIEKLTWTIVIIIVWYFCISLILKAYNKWVSSPVIITFATTETAISEIPFPAITICPEVKSDPEMFNYTHVLLKKIAGVALEEKEERYFESFSLVCKNFENKLGNLLAGADNLTVRVEVVVGLIEASPVMSLVYFSSLHWLEKFYEFDQMLSGTFTSDGLCYSFNMLDFDEILVRPEEHVRSRSLRDTKPRKWSLEDGYPDDAQMETFPRRTFIPGIIGGFMLEIFTNHSHLDYLCGDALQGFKVTLHHPAELPDMDNHFRIPLDQAVYVGIKPRMITVSETLRSYKPDARKCYFVYERHLKYFKSYTQNNCLSECISNYTLIECGCLAFYMPSKVLKFCKYLGQFGRKKCQNFAEMYGVKIQNCFIGLGQKDDETPICGPGSQECLKRAKANHLSNGIDYDTVNTSGVLLRSSCGCLPSCSSLEYDVEISQTDLYWKLMLDEFSRLGLRDSPIDFEKISSSRIAVFYKDTQFLSTERNELYGYVEFFSNAGGLLGLFIGFSVTSLVEILYFLTLRLACNIRKFGKAYWSGEPELIDKNSSKNDR